MHLHLHCYKQSAVCLKLVMFTLKHILKTQIQHDLYDMAQRMMQKITTNKVIWFVNVLKFLSILFKIQQCIAVQHFTS